jgi:hypothetical protein
VPVVRGARLISGETKLDLIYLRVVRYKQVTSAMPAFTGIMYAVFCKTRSIP